jgi:hypothetical protein
MDICMQANRWVACRDGLLFHDVKWPIEGMWGINSPYTINVKQLGKYQSSKRKKTAKRNAEPDREMLSRNDLSQRKGKLNYRAVASRAAQ